jgi:hypothetical protein
MAKRENKTTLSIPTDITRKVRAKAISEGTSMSAITTALLRMWLGGKIELPEPEDPQGESLKPKRKRKDKPTD